MSFQIKHNYLLAMCVAALIAVCFLSINAPIRFKRERDIREAAVKQRLMKIRTAEERYRAATGVYTGDFTVLVRSGCIADSLTFIPYAGGKRFRDDRFRWWSVPRSIHLISKDLIGTP